MFEGLPLAECYAAARARNAQLRVTGPSEPPDDSALAALGEALPGLIAPPLLAMLRTAGGTSLRVSNGGASGIAEVRIMSPEEVAGRTLELHEFLRRFGDGRQTPTIVIFAQYFGEYYCFSKAEPEGGRAVFTADHDGLVNYESNTIRIAGDEEAWLARMFAHYLAGGEDFAYWVPRP